MTDCTSCGATLPGTARFCADCGAAAPAGDATPAPQTTASAAHTATAVAPPQEPGRVIPPAAPGATPATAVPSLAFDWRRLLVGNWVGAGMVALATAFTTGLLGLLLALLAKPEDFGLSNTLTLATIIATGAFGADLRAEGSSDDFFEIEGVATIGAAPLTVTLVALAVALVLFRRITRHQTSGLAAVGDAARTALVFGFALLVPALVLRTENDELGRGWARQLNEDATGIEAAVGADAAGAFFVGLLLLFTVLAASTLLRRDWWHGRMSQVQAWVAAPLAGVATLAALLPVAGIVGFVSMALFGESTDTEVTSDDLGAFVALLVAYVGNAGFVFLGLGAGSRLGVTGATTGEGSTSDWERLWGQVTEDEPGLWISPVLLLAVLLVATLVVLRLTARSRAVPVLGAWLAALLVAVPLLSRLSSMHVSVSATFDGEDFDSTAYVGLDGFQTTVLVALVAALVSLGLAFARGLLDPATVKAGLSRTLGSLQSAPSAQDRPADPAAEPVDDSPRPQ